MSEPAAIVDNHAGMTPGRAAPPRRLTAAVLLLVVVAGALCLAMPFSGDQAYLALYGRRISEGAVLYRDVFDVKQPGIFVFYALGGMLFGFTEVGIHLLELGYWLAFSAFAVVALRPFFTARWAAPVVPLFTVVVYYLHARPQDLAQIEMLVAFPLLAAWWLTDQADPGTRRGLRRFAAAGVLAAAVVLLKHLYVLLPLGFLAYALLRSRRRGVAAADLGRAALAFCGGLVVPLLVVGAYFALHGQLARIWWAYFELTPAGRSLAPRPMGRLTGGATNYLIGHAAIAVLAVVGCVDVLWRRVRPQRDLVVAMLLWGGIGAALLYPQFWLVYHWLLFTVPLGILAVYGVEALVPVVRSRSRRTLGIALAGATALAALGFLAGAPARQTLLSLLLLVAVGGGAGMAVVAGQERLRNGMLLVLGAALALAAGLMATTPADKLHLLSKHDLALSVEARSELRHAWYPPYRAADDDLAVLRSGGSLPGPLFVFGNPVLLVRADRPPAASLNGWSYEIYDRRAWQQLHDELRSTAPPYIVVEAAAPPLIRERFPALMAFIETEYEIAFAGASGTWHIRR